MRIGLFCPRHPVTRSSWVQIVGFSHGRRRGELLKRTVRIHGEGVSRGTDAEGKASEPGRSSRYANICKGQVLPTGVKSGEWYFFKWTQDLRILLSIL